MAETLITIDDLLAEYDRLGVGKDHDGLSTEELSDRWGLSRDAVLKRLKVARSMGILRVGAKAGIRLDGKPMRVPCYWIERPAKNKTGRHA